MYRVPLSLNPEESIAPPCESGQMSLKLHVRTSAVLIDVEGDTHGESPTGAYGPSMLEAIAAPIQ